MLTKPPTLQYQFRWLFNLRTDLLFFFCPFALGLALLGLFNDSGVASVALWSFMLAQGLGIGPFHLGATLTHMEDSQIRKQVIGEGLRAKLAWLALIGVIAFTMLGVFFYYRAIYVIWLIWTIQHLVQQNVGILRLYYNHGQECVPDRSLEIATLYRSSWLWSIIAVLRLDHHEDWQRTVLVASAVIVLAWFVHTAWIYLSDLRRQASTGVPINVSALMYWAVSVCFLAPFALLGKDYTQALLVPLVMHWFQYIIVNFVLFQRKQSAAKLNGAPTPNLIRQLLIASLTYVAIVLGIGFLSETGRLTELQATIGRGLIMSLTFLHYGLDALVWRLSDPVIRGQLLPFLKPGFAISESRRGEAQCARAEVHS